MKNEQQTTFNKKVTSKRRGKNQAFHAFTHTRLFSISSNFFGVTFFGIFSCTWYKILYAKKPIFFFKDIFFNVLLVLFGNFEA
jgi:hypothetical protein